MGMEVDQDVGTARAGPTCIEDTWAWTSSLLADMSRTEHGIDKYHLLDQLMGVMQKGLVMVTDCSGMGMPEMMISTLVNTLTSQYGSNIPPVRCWRSSDIGQIQRECAKQGCGGPEHVFGDLIGFLPTRMQGELRKVISEHVQQVEELITQGCCEKSATDAIRHDVWDAVVAVLKKGPITRETKAPCFKCRRSGSSGRRMGSVRRCRNLNTNLKLCPINPPGIRPTLAVSGTPCVSWSSMGKQCGWMAKTFLPFLSWVYAMLSSCPDLIVHECTQNFDWQMLRRIFEDKDMVECPYHIQSFVFCPTDCGVPMRRARCWTIMIRKDALGPMRVPRCNFSQDGFGQVFFRRIVSNGHMYWCAPREDVLRHLCMAAKKAGRPELALDDESALSHAQKERLADYTARREK